MDIGCNFRKKQRSMLTITRKNPFQKSTFKQAIKGKSFTKSSKTFTRPFKPSQRPPLPRIEQKPADMQQSNYSHTKLTFCYQDRSETFWFHEPAEEQIKQMKAYQQYYVSQHPVTEEDSYTSTQKKGQVEENSQSLDDFQEQHTFTSRKQQEGINLEYLFGSDLDISTCQEENIEVEEAVAEHICTFQTSMHHQGPADWLGIIDEAQKCQNALRQNKQPPSYLNTKLVFYITSIIDFLTSKNNDLLSPSQRGQLCGILRIMGSNLTNYCILMMANLQQQYSNTPEPIRCHYQLEYFLIKQRLLTLQQMSQGNYLRQDTEILLLELQTRL